MVDETKIARSRQVETMTISRRGLMQGAVAVAGGAVVSSFARNGDPNHAGLPKWPAFSSETVPTMVFDNTCEVKMNHDAAIQRLSPYTALSLCES